MSTKTKFLTFTLMLISFGLFAQEEGGIQSINFVEMLTPLIVLGMGYLVRLVVKVMPGWVMLLVVSSISGLVAWASDMAGMDDLGWLQQTLYGLLAVVIDQFSRQIKKATNPNPPMDSTVNGDKDGEGKG